MTVLLQFLQNWVDLSFLFSLVPSEQFYFLKQFFLAITRWATKFLRKFIKHRLDGVQGRITWAMQEIERSCFMWCPFRLSILLIYTLIQILNLTHKSAKICSSYWGQQILFYLHLSTMNGLSVYFTVQAWIKHTSYMYLYCCCAYK